MARHSTDTGLSEHEIGVLRMREKHGWFVMKVMEGEGSPAFAYSFGLFEEFGHPEIIVFGLDLALMHRLINDIGDRARNGNLYTDGTITDDLLNGFPCAFRRVNPLRYKETCCWAAWFYANAEFPVLQLIWPDKSGRFPWETECNHSVRDWQPDLSAAPISS
jgi:hypothetical protein